MHSRKLAAALAATSAAVVLVACGGGESAGGGGGAQRPDPQQAFLQSMVPHHRSAVEMAEVAETEAESDFVKGLAGDITASQNEEIALMERIHERLYKAPLRPDMGAHAALGLSAREAGMNHMDGAMMIRGKRPFDRAFIDHMIPHHEGATRMAEVVLPETRDRELRRLAEEIIAAQRKEIAEMKRFREREYGAAAAAPPLGAGHGAGHGG
jgi:uncharacterized protein (DUF305 family)